MDEGTPTEELIYEHIREAPQQQMELANQLDDKMLRIFGAASVVIGLLGLSTISVSGWRVLFSLLPLVPYVLTAFFTFRHINPERFHWGMRADELPKYWEKESGDVRRALIGDIGKSYLDNKPILEKKARYIRCSLFTTAFEVVLVVAVIILLRL